MRLDKYLSNAGSGSRKYVKQHIRKGSVEVEDIVIKDPKFDVPADAAVKLGGERIILESGIYFMLNKPRSVITSTESGRTKTVMDLIDHPQKGDLFPVGRLDKDTTGLLVITDDGKLSHELLTPKNKIGKTYIATLRDEIDASDISKLEAGIPLKDFTASPASAKKLADNVVELTITEGKFHQVKRMFQYLGNEVDGLKRIAFHTLNLDETLDEGGYRRLTDKEIDMLKK
ncbi:pseudouridine synthase [Salinicoccus albus]|uniref:pseudouridine synthase n=1 Tax=Salinicoccus albus TaxID=418756 RepID=UPI0003776425|nr:pseudouridine synthase [Salinicoccus albus]